MTGYQILRGTTPGTETLLTTVGTGTSYLDTAVTVQTRYFYLVRAVNIIGPGLASNEAQGVPNSGVPSPPVLTAVASPGMVSLSWPTINDNGSPLTKVTVVRNGIRMATLLPNALSWVDTTVTKGTSYRYQVKASNTVGSSNFSNSVTLVAQ